jgi:signal transduction histidine kinase/CheY-like chemotaxis protein
VFTTDVQSESCNPLAAYDREQGFRTYLGLPIQVGGEVLGVLTFNTREPRTYSPEELACLTSFAAQAAIAITNARLYQAAQQELAERRKAEETLRTHRDRLETLLQSSLQLARLQPLEQLVGALGAACARLLHADGGDVRIVEGGDLVKIVGWGTHEAVNSPLRLRMGAGLSGAMAATGDPLVVDDLPDDMRLPPAVRDAFRRLGCQSWFGVPVVLGTRLLGTLNMWSRQRFTPEDIAVATAFAAQVAIALENARLYAELTASFEQLKLTQAALVQGEKLRALGQMAAGIAHDLNNMLAVILGQAELIRLQTGDGGVQQALKILCTAASDGAQVVRRLQGFGRQKANVPLVPCDLPSLVREALALTRPRWRDEAQRENRAIQASTAFTDIPPVLGEPSEIREALTNLVLNAVDAMPTGGTLGITACVVPTPATGDGVSVELAVSDSGVGMSDDVRSRIFDPFFTTKGVKGTGLGLAVVYGIMERHGGSIAVESTPGVGTTFRLRFRAAESPHHGRPEVSAAAAPAHARILLVDDDAVVRSTIATLLRVMHHTVVEAASGAEALAYLAEETVDLVITDLGMPKMTGSEVAERIQSLRPGVPVILLTGWGQQLAGAPPRAVDQVLSKPIRVEALQAAITQVLAGRRG